MNFIDYSKIGKRIKERRKSRGLTQEKLAEICEISPSFLAYIESGKRAPSLETIYNISCVLECGLDCFFIDDTKRNRYTDTINSYLEFMDEEDCLKLCKIIKIFAEHMDEVD